MCLILGDFHTYERRDAFFKTGLLIDQLVFTKFFTYYFHLLLYFLCFVFSCILFVSLSPFVLLYFLWLLSLFSFVPLLLLYSSFPLSHLPCTETVTNDSKCTCPGSMASL